MKKLLFRLVVAGNILLFFGCGPSNQFRQTYTSALSIGDLIEVDVDTKALTYSYKVIEGDWKDKTGAGTLKPLNAFKNHAFETDLKTIGIAIKDEVVIGAVGKNFYVGVPKLSGPIPLANVAGIYNFVAYSPTGFLNKSNDKSSYGTIWIKADKTWDLFVKKDASKSGEKADFSGILSDNGTGTLRLMDESGNKIANVMIRQEANNKHFAVVDLVAPGLKGIAFGAFQSKFDSADAQGDYDILTTNEMNKSIKGSLNQSKLSVTEDGKTMEFTVNYDAPWTGLIAGKFFPTGKTSGGYVDVFGIQSTRSKSVYGVLQYFDSAGEAAGDTINEAFIGFKE